MPEADSSTRSVEVFFAYSHKDEKLRDELAKHLSSLKRLGLIKEWHDRRIEPGAEWNQVIDAQLNRCQIVLLLISADFISSDYCYGVEMKRALERQERGEARVIPVILRPCDWTVLPFGRLQALPKDGKAVTRWGNQDEGFTDVARGIRIAAETILAETGERDSSSSARPHDWSEQSKVAMRIPRWVWVVIGAALAAFVVWLYLHIQPPKNTPILGPPPGFVWIPAGVYMMGCSPDDSSCYADELPRHTVKLSKGFFLKRTEVTVDDFRHYARAAGAPLQSPDLDPQHPVANVTWEQAKAYCEWSGGRLPTEAEWEYAARAGSEERYYGPLDDIAWHQGNTPLTLPMSVGRKQQNKFGLHDMVGNVWEWVGDWYSQEYYRASPLADPQGPETGTERVMRGGSHLDGPEALRVSKREGRAPNVRAAHIGFRCAQEP